MDTLLKSLCDCDAVAAKEEEVRACLYSVLKDNCDEVLTDHMGSIIFHKKGNGPKLMLCAHMDEVGFLVQHISERGMAFVMPLGGVKPLSQYMQKVRVKTTQGKKYTGILMCDSASEHGAKDTYVDFGFLSDKEVEQAGIQIGDMVCFATEAEELSSGRIAAKALDDRSGCYILAKTLLALKEECVSSDLYFAFTSSEEVGLRGSKTAVQMIQPDAALVVDIGSTKNVHSRDFKNHRQLGKGPMLLYYDKGFLAGEKMTAFITTLAKRAGISLQSDFFSGGGTDADTIHTAGIGTPCALIGIPVHYAHGAYSLAHHGDLEAAVNLCTEVCKSFSRAVYEKLVSFLPE